MCNQLLKQLEKNTHFSHLNNTTLLKNNKNAEETLIKSTNDNRDLFDCHLAICGKGDFKKMECIQILTYYPDEEYDEEEDIRRVQRESDAWFEEQRNFDERAYCNGNNHLNQKFVICFEKSGVYALRHCGHQSFVKIVMKIKVIKIS